MIYFDGDNYEFVYRAHYVNENNQTLDNNELTSINSNLHSYAYCSDTRFSSRIIPIISNVDVLYHEATFSEKLGY